MPLIRQADSADVPAIAGLIDAAYRHYIPIVGGTPRPMLDDHAARVRKGETFLCEDADGTLLALITLGSGTLAEALHVFNIAVDPAAQGKGLIRDLLAFAETQARQRALGWLTLYTHALMTRNRAIYAHLGFEVLGEEDGGGYTIVFMRRAVPTA